jgi:tape measure domain-containing protein
MANSIAKLAILLTTDATGVGRGFAQAGQHVQKFSSQLTGMAAQLGLMAGGAGAAGFVGWGVKLAADAEQASIAFRVLMGDAGKAKELLGEIKTMALNTPFGEAGLRQGAQTLLQFGMAGENVMPVMSMLGDISLGNEEKFRLLSLAFGQMSSAGRLMGQDLLQFINAGFNPLQEISRTTGESMANLKKRMEDGGISAQEVARAFQSATGEGGRFNGMMNEMGNSISAKWAKLTEETGQLAMKLGTQLLPALNSIIGAGSQLVSFLSGVDRSTMVWVGSIGAAIYIAPKLIAGIRAIALAFRSMATAQAIQQALSGPKGWATLAAGLAIAAGSAIAVNSAFDSANKTLAESSAAATKAAEATKKLNVELFTGAAPKKDEAAEAAKKAMDDMRKQGEQLASSLRTPFEQVRDELLKARDLWDAGAISGETYSRAMAKAREDLAAQSQSADEIRNKLRQQNGPVAALQFGTQQAISAMNTAAREQKIAAEVEKQMLAEQRRTNELLKKWIDDDDDGFTVNEVNL